MLGTPSQASNPPHHNNLETHTLLKANTNLDDSLEFETLPQCSLIINGKVIHFVIDKEMEHSVLRRSEFKEQPKLSGRYIKSVSTFGKIVKEYFTVPLNCKDEHMNSFKHCFLLSSSAPLSVLGRDMIRNEHRTDVKAEPLSNPDLNLFVNGITLYNPETHKNQVGFAVVDKLQTLKSGSLPQTYSIKAAELIAVIEACRLAGGKRVNIFTDSKYAVELLHNDFIKTDDKSIVNANKVSELQNAIKLPEEVAVCFPKSHNYLGAKRAEVAAKLAASIDRSLIDAKKLSTDFNSRFPTKLSAMQRHATDEDICIWKRSGCVQINGVWFGNDKPCLPKHFFPYYAKLSHGKNHSDKYLMFKLVCEYWYTKEFTVYAGKYCENCYFCTKDNPQEKQKDIFHGNHCSIDLKCEEEMLGNGLSGSMYNVTPSSPPVMRNMEESATLVDFNHVKQPDANGG